MSIQIVVSPVYTTMMTNPPGYQQKALAFLQHPVQTITVKCRPISDDSQAVDRTV